MDEKNNKAKKRLPIIFAVIPFVFFLIELSLIVYSFVSQIVNWSASTIITGLLSILGMFFVPVTSLIFEIIGLILSIKRKLKNFIIIYTIEMVLTILSCIVFVLILRFWWFLLF